MHHGTLNRTSVQTWTRLRMLGLHMLNFLVSRGTNSSFRRPLNKDTWHLPRCCWYHSPPLRNSESLMMVPLLSSVLMIRAQMAQVSVVMPSLGGECWYSVYKKSLINVGKSQGWTTTLLRDKWRWKEKWSCQVECRPKGAGLLRLPPHFLVGSRGGGGERWHSIYHRSL